MLPSNSDDGIVGSELTMESSMAEHACLDSSIVQSTFGYSREIIDHIFLV